MADGGTSRNFVNTDYGTTTLEASWRTGVPGVKPKADDTKDVIFQGKPKATQQLYFDYDPLQDVTGRKRFYWGPELEDLLEQGKVDIENVIFHFKILFYPSLEASRLATPAKKILFGLREYFGLAPDALIDEIKTQAFAMHLESLVKFIKDYIMNRLKSQARQTQRDTSQAMEMPLQLSLAVPSVCTAPGYRWITKAAELAAGIEEISLVPEAQAAAAEYLQDLEIHDANVVAKGSIIGVTDIGGGTVDLSLWRLKQDSTYGAETKMKLIDDSGEPCGFEFVDTEFMEWMIKNINKDKAVHPGGFPKLLDNLNLTEAAFTHKARTAFARNVKDNFQPLRLPPYEVHVDGGTNATMKDFRVEMTSAQVVEFFAPVLKKILGMIKTSLQDYPETGTMIFLGGGSNSRYAMDKFRDALGDRIRIEDGRELQFGASAVARGPLSRFYEAGTQSLVVTDSFVITEQRQHLEGFDDDLQYMTEESEIYPGEYWVKGLSKTVVPPGTDDSRKAPWQLHIVKSTQEEFELQLYWTKGEKDDGTIMFKDITCTELTHEFQQWGPPLVIRVPDMSEFELKLPSNDIGNDEEDDEYGQPQRKRAKTASKTATKQKSARKEKSPRKQKTKAVPLGKAAAGSVLKCVVCKEMFQPREIQTSQKYCADCLLAGHFEIYIRIVRVVSPDAVKLHVEMAKAGVISEEYGSKADFGSIEDSEVVLLREETVFSRAYNPTPRV